MHKFLFIIALLYINASYSQDTIKYTNGEKYIGNIVNGYRDGFGEYFFNDGDRYSGNWKSNKFDGDATYYYANGDYKIGKWENNQCITYRYFSNGKELTVTVKKIDYTKINGSNYDINVYAHPIEKEFRYNLKVFRGVISNDNSILSLIFGIGADGNSGSYGNHLISTNKFESNSIDLFRERKMSSELFYYNEKDISVYDCNSNMKENNTIFFAYDNNNGVELNEVSLSNSTNLPIITTNLLPYEFELNSGEEGIETFKVGHVKLGNGISGFLGMSLYDYKTYLFIYDYKARNKYRKIDLSKVSSTISNTIGQLGRNVCLKYKGNKSGSPYETNIYSISNIVQNENYIYVFLKSLNWDFALPICIRKSDFSVSIKSNSFFSLGIFETDEIMKKVNSTGGYNYLPFSNEFINYYNIGSDIKLDVYNNNIDKTWSITLNDINIKHINECGDFIIIGGYTKSAGYKGFSNPKIIVINKITHAISYSKVIAKKNAMVNTINFDSNNNVIITIGGLAKHEETDDLFSPQIIIDKLNPEGKFINNLFIK